MRIGLCSWIGKCWSSWEWKGKFKNVDELSDVCEVFVLSNISILQNLQLTCNRTLSEWMNDAFVLKPLPDRKFDRSNSMLFQWCRHQDALEPRRERDSKKKLQLMEKVWRYKNWFVKGKTTTTSTRNRRRVSRGNWIYSSLCTLKIFGGEPNKCPRWMEMHRMSKVGSSVNSTL